MLRCVDRQHTFHKILVLRNGLTHQNKKRKNEEITMEFNECFELVVNPIKLHESPSGPMDEIIDIDRLYFKNSSHN